MNGQARQKGMLAILGVLALILVWRYIVKPAFSGGAGGDAAVAPVAEPGDEEAGMGTQPALPQPGGRPEDTEPGEERVAALRTGDLERVPPVYTPGRDPWRFVDPPPPPEPPPPPGPTAEELRAREEARRRAQEAAAAAAAVAAVEAAKPKPPEFTLTYIGQVGPADQRYAVFSDGSKTEFTVSEGEVLQGKFVVARIGLESVDIRYVDFPDWPAKRVPLRPR